MNGSGIARGSSHGPCAASLLEDGTGRVHVHNRPSRGNCGDQIAQPLAYLGMKAGEDFYLILLGNSPMTRLSPASHRPERSGPPSLSSCEVRTLCSCGRCPLEWPSARWAGLCRVNGQLSHGPDVLTSQLQEHNLADLGIVVIYIWILSPRENPSICRCEHQDRTQL